MRIYFYCGVSSQLPNTMVFSPVHRETFTKARVWWGLEKHLIDCTLKNYLGTDRETEDRNKVTLINVILRPLAYKQQHTTSGTKCASGTSSQDTESHQMPAANCWFSSRFYWQRPGLEGGSYLHMSSCFAVNEENSLNKYVFTRIEASFLSLVTLTDTFQATEPKWYHG